MCPALPIRAVVLDWTGTVLDFGDLSPALALVETLRLHGVRVPVAEARAVEPGALGALVARPAVARAWASVHDAPPDLDVLRAELLPVRAALLLHTPLVPGIVGALAALRGRGLAVGSTTDLPRELGELLAPVLAERGFAPDAVVCAEDAGERPDPGMVQACARQLGVPPAAVVKVDDAVDGIEAGLRAGAWTVGVAVSGGLVGLSLAEVAELSGEELVERRDRAAARLRSAGAHVVVDTVYELPGAIEQIEATSRHGDGP